MVISGKAYWASIATPNTTFDPDGEINLIKKD